MNSKRVEMIEKALGVTLSAEYARFISKTGFETVDGIEIYGYTEDMTDPTKAPCVIGATRLYRRIYPLDDWDVVISGSRFEDRITILNTIDGKIYEVGFHVRNCIARNFDLWHTNRFQPQRKL